ncbi:MAG: hypothetical protein KVP17_001533 [Porospora cf. gigantea B]|nr:MAG: hypothetical protein KVP17_001533 [Porospora cf. gigantea B]
MPHVGEVSQWLYSESIVEPKALGELVDWTRERLLDASWQQDRQLQQQACELCALSMVKLGRWSEFTSLTAQLQHVLSGADAVSITESTYLTIACRLLHLFACGQEPEMLYVLEMPILAGASSPHIDFVVNLRQSVTEGYYKRAAAMLMAPTHALFGPLTSLTTTLLREKVATALEKAYEHVPVNFAMELLLFTDINELAAFCRERNDALPDVAFVDTFQNQRRLIREVGEELGRKPADKKALEVLRSAAHCQLENAATARTRWELEAGRLSIVKEAVQTNTIPALALTEQLMNFATEIERII